MTRHEPRRLPRSGVAWRLWLALLLSVVALWSPQAAASPEAHILRIDPRASLEDGAPVLTTVLDLVQTKRMSEISSACSRFKDNAQLDCFADKLAKPGALYSTIKFPKKQAMLTVTVDGTDIPAKLVSAKRWGAAKGQSGVGTAWLILVDAAASMKNRFGDAKTVAKEFIKKMGPNDIVDVMFFNDRTVVKDSRWLAKKGAATAFVDSVGRPFPKQGRSRPLFNIIKQGATDGFKELGNTGQGVETPMHQALVVLSNGSSGSDSGSASSVALALSDYLTKGRFPEDNQTLPKAPVPVVSVWFPVKGEQEEFFQNARAFMENLANIPIGGTYAIVRGGAASRGPKIVAAARARFDQMQIVKWRVSCIAPTVGQTFKLVFKNTKPSIAGDNFINVPVGIDPTTWPLDVNVEETESYAKKNPVKPGGKVRVFGNFCWGADHKRAKLYMIPKKQQLPETLKGQSVDDAKKAQQQLIASNMVGKATSAGDTYVDFIAPEKEKFLSGKGKKMTARMVLFDSVSKRTSAVTSSKVLTLNAGKKDPPWLLIGGGVFGGVVLILLLIAIARGGGGGRRRRR